MKHSRICGPSCFISMRNKCYTKCVACDIILECMYWSEDITIGWCEICECQIILDDDKNKVAVV